MGRYAPTTQPTAVTTDAVIVAIPIGAPGTTSRLRRVVCEYVSGDASSYTAVFTTDPLATDKTKAIISLTGGSTTVPLDVTEPANGIVWDNNHHDGNIYCQVDPNAGVNNAFRVAVYLD